MESGASKGGKGVRWHPLLGAGLVSSALAILVGVGSLVFALLTLSDNPCYMDVMGAYAAIGLALVLLVPGAVGLRACIRRIRGKVEAGDLRRRRRLGVSLTAGGLLVALIGFLGFLPFGFEMGVLALVIGLVLVCSAGPTRVPAEAETAEDAEAVDADAVHE